MRVRPVKPALSASSVVEYIDKSGRALQRLDLGNPQRGHLRASAVHEGSRRCRGRPSGRSPTFGMAPSRSINGPGSTSRWSPRAGAHSPDTRLRDIRSGRGRSSTTPSCSTGPRSRCAAQPVSRVAEAALVHRQQGGGRHRPKDDLLQCRPVAHAAPRHPLGQRVGLAVSTREECFVVAVGLGLGGDLEAGVIPSRLVHLPEWVAYGRRGPAR